MNTLYVQNLIVNFEMFDAFTQQGLDKYLYKGKSNVSELINSAIVCRICTVSASCTHSAIILVKKKQMYLQGFPINVRLLECSSEKLISGDFKIKVVIVVGMKQKKSKTRSPSFCYKMASVLHVEDVLRFFLFMRRKVEMFAKSTEKIYAILCIV